MSGMGFRRLTAVKMLMLLFTIVASTTTSPITTPPLPPNNFPGPHCPTKCGEVAIRFPFGTEPNCSLNETYFHLTCNHSYDPPKLFSGNIPITNISLDGQLHISDYVSKDCYKPNGESNGSNTPWLDSAEYTISNAQNKFTVIGCDSYGFIHGKIGKKNYTASCTSLCDSIEDVIEDGSCWGMGCCQIDLPKGLKSIQLKALSFDKHVNVRSFNPCTTAFVVENAKFNFSSRYLRNFSQEVPLVVDWAILGYGKCNNNGEANSTSSNAIACKANAKCYDAGIDPDGYRCRCKPGYKGNPYRGCQDIDECGSNSNKCGENSKCQNTEGSYTCVPDVKEFGNNKIVLSVGISILSLLMGSTWLYLMLKRRKLIKLKEKFFEQNGGLLLQQRFSQVSGTSGAPKIFIAEELNKATKNFVEKGIIGRGGFGTIMSTIVQGTLGYLDPEYIHTTQLTEISDVYRFGVVLLELLTGKQVLSFGRPENERSLVTHFLSALRDGRLFRILETNVASHENKEQIKEVAKLATKCVKVKGEERPTMKEVSMEFEGMHKVHYLRDTVELNPKEIAYLLPDQIFESHKHVEGSSTSVG